MRGLGVETSTGLAGSLNSPRKGKLVNALTPDGFELTSLGVAFLLLAHMAVWAVAATIAQGSGGLHHDMTEAYDWGREFQLGYYKHPPLFSWIAGAWFVVFPRTDWAFYLLSAVSAGGGLLGVWFLAGRLMPNREQTLSLLLLMLTPFFSVLAITYNANAALLLIWPWTAWAFVRSVQTGKLGDGALFGLLAALALLTKYSSIFLLLACFTAAILHRRRMAYFTCLAPYAAMLVCAAVCLPHAIWVLEHPLTPVNYLLKKPVLPLQAQLLAVGTSLLGAAALFALPQAAVAAALGAAASLRLLGKAATTAIGADNRWLAALALGPLALTVGCGFLFGVKLSTNYFLPALFMVPIAFTKFAEPGIAPERRRIFWRFLAGWLLFGMLAAPLVAIAAFVRHSDQSTEPAREIALEATRLWHEAFGQKLRLVAGTETYGLSAPFYSPDAPHLYLFATPAASPWIAPSDLARGGLLIICDHADTKCAAIALEAAPPSMQRRSVRLARDFLGWSSREFYFDLFMIPPGPQP